MEGGLAPECWLLMGGLSLLISAVLTDSEAFRGGAWAGDKLVL